MNGDALEEKHLYIISKKVYQGVQISLSRFLKSGSTYISVIIKEYKDGVL